MKRMYNILFALIAIAIASNNLCNAQSVFEDKTVYTCGKQPSYSYTSSENSTPTPFFICSGQDANFNFQYDEGEERASAYRYASKYTNPIIKSEDLILESVSYNLRPGVDELKSKIYIPSVNHIYIYSYPFFTNILDSVYVPNCRAAEVDESFVYAASGDFTNPGKIYKFTKADLKAKDSLDTDVLPFQIMSLPNSTIAMTIDGSFGKPDGKLVFYKSDFYTFSKMKEFIIGNMPNHIAKCGDYLYVTLNGGHKVIIVDWMSQTIKDSIEIPTTGGDGPRQTLVLNPMNSSDYQDFTFYTTAYDGHIYYGKGTKVTDKSENNDKKREAIAYFSESDVIIVTDISNKDYSPANTVTIYKRNSNVDESITNLNIYPNPVSNIINISFENTDNSECDVTIYDILGNIVSQAKSEIISGKFSYDISGLSLINGTYYIDINTPNKLHKSKFVIK